MLLWLGHVFGLVYDLYKKGGRFNEWLNYIFCIILYHFVGFRYLVFISYSLLFLSLLIFILYIEHFKAFLVIYLHYYVNF